MRGPADAHGQGHSARAPATPHSGAAREQPRWCPLLAYAIRRASRTAIAMEARGLGSAAARTVFAAPRYRPADLVFAVSAVLLLVVMVAASGLLPNTRSKIVSTCLKW